MKPHILEIARIGFLVFDRVWSKCKSDPLCRLDTKPKREEKEGMGKITLHAQGMASINIRVSNGCNLYIICEEIERL
jgi:hypothetical protein